MTAVRYECARNKHPNTDGTPWGVIQLRVKGEHYSVRVATFSGHDAEKLCGELISLANQRLCAPDIHEELESERVSVKRIERALDDAAMHQHSMSDPTPEQRLIQRGGSEVARAVREVLNNA